MIDLKLKFATVIFTVFAFCATAMADISEGPVDLLQRKSDEVIKILKDRKSEFDANPELIYAMVDEHIVPHLDDVTMAKLALGKNWLKADNDQKIEFVEQFRTLLIRTYGKSLQEFSDQTIKFFPVDTDVSTTKVIVKSEVLQTSGPAIPVSYRMRVKENEWVVYDINIDGVSLVTSYRGTFAQEMRKGGMAGILKMLHDKNSKVAVEPVKPGTQTTNASQASS